MYQPTNAPQSVGGVLDDGFRLYRASLSRVLALTFFGALVGQVPNFMMSVSGTLPSLNAAVIVTLGVCMLASGLFYAAAVCRMDAVAGQRELTLGGAVSIGARRLLPLIVYSLLYGVIVAVGMLLLVVPGVIFGLSLMFGTFAVLVDGKGPVESLKFSHALVWGNWWRTMVIVSVATIVMVAAYMLVIFVSGVSLALGAGGDPGMLTRLIELVVVPLLGAVLGPLFYALTLATYYDLRLRRTGADLEQRLGVPAGA